MLPAKTPWTNKTFVLPGGGPDSDLPVEYGFNGGAPSEPVLRSCWVLTDEERDWIKSGGMVELVIFGEGHPPVAMHVVDEEGNVLGTAGDKAEYRMPKVAFVADRQTPAGQRAKERLQAIFDAGDGSEGTVQYWMQVAYEALLDKEEAPDYRSMLKDAANTADHLFSMIDKDTWRSTGSDDGQGHYEGDYRAEKVLEDIKAWKAATVCPTCEDRGEVAVTPGQPGDGSMACPTCQ